jgi:hypothetical protein
MAHPRGNHKDSNDLNSITGTFGSRLAVISLALSAAFAFLTFEAAAYYEYSQPNPIYTGCNTCHGDFKAGSYLSLKDGESWALGLHKVHSSDMLSDDCDACHSGAGFKPVRIGISTGGTDLEPLSCSGCHGRSQDGWHEGSTMGYSFGLRLRHWNVNRWVNGVSTRECYDCHPDSTPAWVPASEWLSPPYYASPGTGHPAIPGSPCNQQPQDEENISGGPQGLDNDGDGLLDMDDPDCAPGPATPGEASAPSGSPLRVTGYAPSTGIVSIMYDPACSASDHNIMMGPLEDVSTYGWSSEVCMIGNSGVSSFVPGPGSWFFIVVGTEGTDDGSYGRGRRPDTALYQRPPFTGNACGSRQNLARRCD